MNDQKARFRPLVLVFLFIGISIGVILALQIQSHPIQRGRFPLEQVELQKSIFEAFSGEQEELRKRLESVSRKREEVSQAVENRSSKKTRETLTRLRSLAGLGAVTGSGIRIVLDDHPVAARPEFSLLNENFVQATDLRDLVNALFLQDAKAVSINSYRVTPLIPIQSAFDSILVSSIQIGPPFTVEAVGNPEALLEAVEILEKRKIKRYSEAASELAINPVENPGSLEFLTLTP